ncbi:MAG: non-heme iron oxygenase ferredoxin subunit [Dactylosporangium sp.]|nr:non-heme iron oxygenase ferredoxin subunit [Dactylosporangium sp.]NNJ62945.1 non-heme iron oxygenase ferredoxin subunit [Dactylosporangium sp.]
MCSVTELPRGTVRAVDVDGVAVALVRTAEGDLHAVSDQCSHARVPLSEGEVDGCALECWLHGSRFDLRTGQPHNLPATTPVRVYPVEVREGNVYVTVN